MKLSEAQLAEADAQFYLIVERKIAELVRHMRETREEYEATQHALGALYHIRARLEAPETSASPQAEVHSRR